MRLKLVIFYVFVSCFGRVTSQTFAQDEYNLRQILLGPGSNYSRAVRPTQQVDVQIRLNVLTVNGVDTKGQSMSTSGWLTVKWTDPRLTWTPSLHGNIDYIFDTQLSLWRPEIIIDNEIEELGVIEDDHQQLRVSSTGEVIWEPTGVYVTSCNIDIRFYPFDRQSCAIEVTSWVYRITEVNLTHTASTVYLGDYSPNGEWDLYANEVTTKTIVTQTDGSFAQIDFILKLQRRVTFYIMNVILPVFLTSFLSVVTFILPFESGEKVSYALTVLLSYAVLMLLVSDNIPPTSITISVLSVYLTVVLFVGASTTVFAIINLALFHKNPKTPISMTTRAFVSSIMVPLSSWKKGAYHERSPRSGKLKIVPVDSVSSDKEVEKLEPEEAPRNDEFYTWRDIAMMSDVVCFRTYMLFMVVISLIFLICLPAGGYVNG